MQEKANITMKQFVLLFALLIITWFSLSFSITQSEAIAAVISSAIVASLFREFSFERNDNLDAPHVRTFEAFKFALFFIKAEIESHLAVARAVVTGNINPAVVCLKTNAKAMSSKTLLSNAITLTPGTLTVDVGKSLYIHHLNSGKNGSENKFSKLAEKIFG